MDLDASLLVGSRYRRVNRPQPFQVVAFDHDASSIDIEYFDGMLDEWPPDHWHALGIGRCEAPQDEADRRLPEAQADISAARAWNPRFPAPHRKPQGRMKR